MSLDWMLLDQSHAGGASDRKRERKQLSGISCKGRFVRRRDSKSRECAACLSPCSGFPF
jgi:hypothetical protein